MEKRDTASRMAQDLDQLHANATTEALKATIEAPWINTGPDFESAGRAQFAEILKTGLTGARLNLPEEHPNIYMAFGYASAGYGDFEYVAAAVETWCAANDQRHGPEGWILMTQGDGDYGHNSIETIAQMVAARGVPVVFLQSDFGYAEPGTPYWPSYATAGYFGPGIRHQIGKMKNDAPVLDKQGQPVLQECWGGYQKDSEGIPTGELAFVDWAMHGQEFGGLRLIDHVGGVLAAGGGAITVEQAEIYDLFATDEHAVLRRAGDMVIVSADSKGNVSGTASAVLSKYESWRVDELFKQMDATKDGEISVREFCLLAYPGKDAGSVFEAMDLDSSNSISLQEFTHYVAFHKQRHGDVAAALILRDITNNLLMKKESASPARIRTLTAETPGVAISRNTSDPNFRSGQVQAIQTPRTRMRNDFTLQCFDRHALPGDPTVERFSRRQTMLW